MTKNKSYFCDFTSLLFVIRWDVGCDAAGVGLNEARANDDDGDIWLACASAASSWCQL